MLILLIDLESLSLMKLKVKYINIYTGVGSCTTIYPSRERGRYS